MMIDVMITVSARVIIMITVSKLLKSRLVRYNSYYIVIGINIIRNKRSYNVITITIHLFGDNT